jgi:hypothetical protein
MRLENEQPISKVELEIQEILELNGIAAEDIQFRGEQRYLRVGYWRQLSQKHFGTVRSTRHWRG